MMQRNLDRRVEVSFPIEDPKLKSIIMKTVLRISLKDSTKARVLKPDMSYELIQPKDGEKKINSQEWLMKHTIKAGGEVVKH